MTRQYLWMASRAGLLLAALLVAAVLWAANSVEPVTSYVETSGSWRDENNGSSPNIAYIDGTTDSYPSTADGLAFCEDTADTGTYTIQFDFDTPANSPSSTTDAQAIRIIWDKVNQTCGSNGAKTDPTFTLRVYDGSSEQTIASSITCSGVGNNSYAWTYVGGSDGSEVYIEFDTEGNGSTGGVNYRCCGIEYVDWYMDYSSTDDGLMVVRHESVKPESVTRVTR